MKRRKRKKRHMPKQILAERLDKHLKIGPVVIKKRGFSAKMFLKLFD
jgi:hypothetical protein